MKKIIGVFACLVLIIVVSGMHAQRIFALPTIPTPASAAPQIPSSLNTQTNSTEGDWVPDANVTFLGKTASRSASLLNWMLVNYKWGYEDSAISHVWVTVRNIVFILLLLVVLGAAFTIIITGGDNISVLLFTKRFIILVLLILFSFAFLRLFYQITDIIQGFFIHNPDGAIISSNDLLSMSFGYQNFLGFRIVGTQFDEPVFISSLLIRLTAITYYVMSFILIIRKIILWFFIIVSPLFPLLLLYSPIKNTAKIWIKEFLRWLLYAPLFTLFLFAVVVIWRSSLAVLPFNFQNYQIVYPTAISILMGGPGQKLGLGNSLNYNDTFAQYVIALIMLWIVILLPFILLQILLDYIEKASISPEFFSQHFSNIRDRFTSGNFPFVKPTSPVGPLGGQSTGRALNIPREIAVKEKQIAENINKIITTTNAGVTQQVSQGSEVSRSSAASGFSGIPTRIINKETTTVEKSSQQTVGMKTSQAFAKFKPTIMQSRTAGLLSFPIPTMRDIVNFETAHLAKKNVDTHTLTQAQDTLRKIADPQKTTSLTEKQQYTKLKEKLTESTTQGDPLAKSILSAASVASETNATPLVHLPAVNQVQTVNLDDYETVKSLWIENYQHIDISDESSTTSRQSWVQHDMDAITEVITLLTSTDPQKIQQGLSRVSSILPFILIGGFSQTEVIAYLKAKLEAGKTVLKDIAQKGEQEDTLATLKKEKVPQENVMHAEAQDSLH